MRSGGAGGTSGSGRPPPKRAHALRTTSASASRNAGVIVDRRRPRIVRPTSRHAAAASLSRSNRTSMWSATNPRGASTAACNPRPPLRAQVVADVRLQPGIGRSSAPALVDDFPVRRAEGVGHETGALLQLGHVPRAAGHRTGNAVRREDDAGVAAQVLRQQRAGVLDLRRIRSHESRVRVPARCEEDLDVGMAPLPEGARVRRRRSGGTARSSSSCGGRPG